ncbi:hypothetical protein MHL30_07645 [Priestia flexa]|uniref:hypothetical protein n=1 Tax=Priestia flexa TaxID=86664 RepID=UPI001EF3DA5A|nr:hypothetical protein [Priestia flexa]MCG7313051.1 hypothetical protein [Priestia flexa]
MKTMLETGGEWSVGHSTPAGKRGKTEIPPTAQRGSSGSSPRKASGRSAMEQTYSNNVKR